MMECCSVYVYTIVPAFHAVSIYFSFKFMFSTLFRFVFSRVNVSLSFELYQCFEDFLVEKVLAMHLLFTLQLLCLCREFRSTSVAAILQQWENNVNNLAKICKRLKMF